MDLETVVPTDATEEVLTRGKGGAKQSAVYKVDDIVVGYRSWNEEGLLEQEIGRKGELRHGPYCNWHDNGVLGEETFYIDGKEHGVARQYDWDGNLIGTYEMHYGTGADLWYGSAGILSEERYYQDGERYGFERWWNHDNETVWIEQHFQAGVEHGVARKWNVRGRLRRGFPQYYVSGEKVTKRQYLKASERDPTLPKFREEDNHPQRPLPRELMARNKAMTVVPK